VLGGGDGVTGSVEQGADVADVLVDRLGPDAGQDGEGGRGQAEALMQDGGEQSVGEGEPRAAAGPGGDLSGAAAAAGQGVVAVCGVQREKRGQQDGPGGGGAARSGPAAPARPGVD
jgi:hypothetical protein